MIHLSIAGESVSQPAASQSVKVIHCSPASAQSVCLPMHHCMRAFIVSLTTLPLRHTMTVDLFASCNSQAGQAL